MRRSVKLSVSCGLTLGMCLACLDIRRTEPPGGAGGSSGSGGSSASGGNSGGSGNEAGQGYLPNQCIEQCVAMAPEGEPSFSALGQCTATAKATACASACAPGATASDPAPAVCPVPGQVDPSVVCSNCLKGQCCANLQRCFGEVACLTIGICASSCQ
jgi:hypothetical protein